MSWSFSECYLMVVCQLVTVWDLLRWCEILTRLCRFSAKVAWKALCSLTATHSTSGSKTRTKEKCESAVLFFLRQFKVLLDESFNGCVHFSETREKMYLFWEKNMLTFWNIWWDFVFEWSELLQFWWNPIYPTLYIQF